MAVQREQQGRAARNCGTSTAASYASLFSAFAGTRNDDGAPRPIFIAQSPTISCGFFGKWLLVSPPFFFSFSSPLSLAVKARRESQLNESASLLGTRSYSKLALASALASCTASSSPPRDPFYRPSYTRSRQLSMRPG